MPALLIESQRVAHTVAHGTHGRRRAGPGETFWQFRHYDQNDARHRHRLAPLGQLRPSLRARARMGSGAYGLAVGRSLAVDAFPLVARPKSSKESRCVVLALALAELLSRGGERVGVLGGRPFTGRAAARRVAEVLLGDTSEASLPPQAKLSRFSECLLFSDFLEPVDVTTERLEDDRGPRRARPSGSGARSGRGDAALCRPHGVCRERGPGPGDRRPRRDVARAAIRTGSSVTGENCWN